MVAWLALPFLSAGGTGLSGTVVSVNPGTSGASLITGNLNLSTGGTLLVGSTLIRPLSGAPSDRRRAEALEKPPARPFPASRGEWTCKARAAARFSD